MLKAKDPSIKIVMLEHKIEQLEKHIQTPQQITNNAIVNHGVVNHIVIKPWGADLEITAADVLAALSNIPSIVGNSEVVEVLMNLTRRAHVRPESRNIHLNPRRGDQALALMSSGWSALPIEEATRKLFDGAVGSISKLPEITGVTNDIVASSIPRQYMFERDDCVQLGLRPMVAHLTNLAPGGPGPCVTEEKQPSCDKQVAAALLKTNPPIHGMDAEYISNLAKLAKTTPTLMVQAIWQASGSGLCGLLEGRTAQEILRDHPELKRQIALIEQIDKANYSYRAN